MTEFERFVDSVPTHPIAAKHAPSIN
jgi:hypothetical protein